MFVLGDSNYLVALNFCVEISVRKNFLLIKEVENNQSF